MYLCGMSVDDVIRRATILFPFQVETKQVEDLFLYLRKEEGIVTTYMVGEQKTIGDQFEDANEDEKPHLTGLTLSGHFVHPDTRAFEGFECKKKPGEDSETPFLYGIKFAVKGKVPLTGYRDETIELWDTVRSLTSRYFEENF